MVIRWGLKVGIFGSFASSPFPTRVILERSRDCIREIGKGEDDVVDRETKLAKGGIGDYNIGVKLWTSQGGQEVFISPQ